MNAKKYAELKQLHNIPDVIENEGQLWEMAAAVERAKTAADVAAIWRKVAARTIGEAIADCRALDKYDNDEGTSITTRYEIGGSVLIENVRQTNTLNAAAVREILTANQLAECTRYGTRCSYDIDTIAMVC